MSNFKNTLARAALDVYAPSQSRRAIDSFQYYPWISGPKTGVYSNATQTIVAHRGMLANDAEDIKNVARVGVGMGVGKDRLERAAAVTAHARSLGKPITHTGHSLGGATARKTARDKGDPNTTFNRYTGFMLDSENAAASKRCRAGSMEPHCSNTTDFYNPQDIAAARIKADYGEKVPVRAERGYRLMPNGPIAVHSAQQFTQAGTGQVGSGSKKKKPAHPQQKLLDLAYQTMKR